MKTTELDKMALRGLSARMHLEVCGHRVDVSADTVPRNGIMKKLLCPACSMPGPAYVVDVNASGQSGGR